MEEEQEEKKRGGPASIRIEEKSPAKINYGAFLFQSVIAGLDASGRSNLTPAFNFCFYLC
jgi:hypothetical protein